MTQSNPDNQRDLHQDKPGNREPGGSAPDRLADTTAGGEATNDVGEDNQQGKGDRPADDYIRR